MTQKCISKKHDWQNDKVFLLNLSREKFMTVNTFQQRQKKKTVQKKDVLLYLSDAQIAWGL